MIYAGSASKILAPGLRLGWLISPPSMTDGLIAAKQAADMGSAALDQLAFADVLERGELDHHLRRMRPIYRGRRDALLAALARHLPDLRPAGAAAGLHVLAWLPDDVDEARVVEEAAAAGIAIGALAARRIAPGPGGLIFGYGVIAETAIEPGVRRLAGIVARSARARPGARPSGPRPASAVARRPPSAAAAAARRSAALVRPASTPSTSGSIGSGASIGGTSGCPVIRRVDRPRVRNENAQRVTTMIRFENPIRYVMWMRSHSSHAVNPPCRPNGPIHGMSVTPRSRPITATSPWLL